MGRLCKYYVILYKGLGPQILVSAKGSWNQCPTDTEDTVSYFVIVLQQQVKFLTESLYVIDSQLQVHIWVNFKCIGDGDPPWDSNLTLLMVAWASGILEAPRMIQLAKAENCCVCEAHPRGCSQGGDWENLWASATPGQFHMWSRIPGNT